MKKLILIGYWHNWQETDWPDPARFVDPTWDSEIRETVINYLDAGELFSVFMGTSWCRFRCREHGHSFGLGSRELTDGVYHWPDGLSHYLEAHNVRLPQPFVDHVLQRSREPTLLESAIRWLAGTPTDSDEMWWREQTGFTDGKSFLSPLIPTGLEVIAAVPPSEPTDAILNFLHRNGFVRYWRISTPEFLDELRQGAEFTAGFVPWQMKKEVQEFIQEFTAKAEKAGISLKFTKFEQED